VGNLAAHLEAGEYMLPCSIETLAHSGAFKRAGIILQCGKM
jgi:hypothetical protein